MDKENKLAPSFTFQKPGKAFDKLTSLDHTSTYQEFLHHSLGSKIEDLPTRLRRLIKITKTLLDKPDILLVDQKALILGEKSFRSTYQVVREKLPKTTMMTIVSKCEDLDLFFRAIVLEKGEVKEYGVVKELIKNIRSKLSQRILEADKKDWDALYRGYFGVSYFEAMKNKKIFGDDKVNLQSKEASEYSILNLENKIGSLRFTNKEFGKVKKTGIDGR